MKTPKHLATAMAVAMVTTSVAPVMAATTTSNEEIIGKNRTETAVKISQDGWKSAETVILVNDSAIPDALTATPLAYAKNAPILLTGKDGLSKETADEIKRLGAKDVIMIGGDAVLTSKVEEDLKALKLKVDRIKGSTREETALAIAKRLDGIKDVSEIAVVNGVTGLADAVSVAAAAAEKGMPILLANPKSGLSVVEKFIKDEAIKSSFIIGGDKAVSNEIAKNLPGKQRIEGANRNDTNAKVIETFYADKNLDNLYLAKDGMENSGQLIDALAVGALAAKNGAPVLIASKKLNANQVNVVNTKKIATITQVGGKGNEGAFNQLKEIEKAEVIKVKNEAELQEALKKANANDTIEIDANATISKDVTLSTNNAIEINVKGDLTGKVTVKTPNADIKNSGTIGTLVVENGKNTTVTNTSAGKIDKVEVDSTSSNVKVENNGSIKDVVNDSSSSKVENNGTISGSVSGSGNTSVEGNKPGETTGSNTGGGSSSGGGSTGGTITPSGALELENEVIEVKPGRQVTIKTKGIKDVENISWEIKEDYGYEDLIVEESVANGGEVTLNIQEKISADIHDADSGVAKTTRVIAKYGNQTKECTIKVIPYTQSEVAEIRVDKGNSMEINAGESFEIVPSIYTRDGIKIYNVSFQGQIHWEVVGDPNEEIIIDRVQNSERDHSLSAKANPNINESKVVTIRAIYGNNDFSADCKCTINPAGTLRLEQNEIRQNPGKEFTIKAAGVKDTEKISWEIKEDEANGDLIEQETVSNGGEVKLKLKEEIYHDEGDINSQNFKTAKVIAKYGNQTKECTIKVIPYTQSEVAEIRLDKGKCMEIDAGQSFELVPSLYTKDGIKIYNTSFLGQMGWKVLSDDNSILTNNGVDTNDGYKYKGTINSKAPSGSKVRLEASYGEDVKTEFELTVKNGGSGEIVQGSGITDVRVVSKDTILVYSKHTGLNSDNMAIKEKGTNKTMTILNNWKHDSSDIREIELEEAMNPNSTYILEVTLNGKTETREIAPVKFVEVNTVDQLKNINNNPENSIILLKAPVYEIDEPIVITKPMTIMSDNPEVDASAPIACIKPSSNYDESNGALLKVENVSKGKVIINSLEIDGLNAETNSGKNIIGMDIVGSNVDMIGSVNISNNKLAGINVKSNSNLIVGAYTYNNGDKIKSGIRIDDTATNVNVVLDDADIAEEAEENGYAVCYNGKIDDSKKINITGTINGEGLVEDYYLENEKITIWSVYNPNTIF